MPPLRFPRVSFRIRPADASDHAVLEATDADVPWNAPFYASCGFRQSFPDTAFLRELVDVEHALGLDAHGTRVRMTAAL